MAINKTTQGDDALVYIIDMDDKKILDIVPYNSFDGLPKYYRKITGHEIQVSYFPHVKDWLNK